VTVSLGEANTPLVATRAFGRQVFFKCEHFNPTGSFKDRGTALLVSFLVSRGVREAVEDSSGNAGASYAAYAARAGIRASVFVPESATGPKKMQIMMYGAQLVLIPGTRSDAATAARKAADGGAVYASHAYLPMNIPGYATCAYEIYESLGAGPGAVIVPAGQGGLLLGLGRGFQALRDAGVIHDVPVLIGVQAAACAPLVARSGIGAKPLNLLPEAETVAEGVRVMEPARADAVLETARQSGGRFVAVPEDRILPGRDALGRLGYYVEPTSALVWHAMETTLSDLPDPVVILLTGSGYKAMR
jgi:threonine synthase